MMHFNLTEGVLVSSLQGLGAFDLAGIAVALLLGGMAKGITGIGVPLIAMPILSQFLPIRHAVLLLSMPIILGNIPQALEGGQVLATARKIAAPIAGTVIGNIVGVAILLSLNPGHAQAASGALLIVAATLMLAAPKLNLPPAWQKPVGFALGFGAALMESIASVPGPLLATYLISSGATGRVFTKQIAIILVVSIVTLLTTFSGAAHASAADLAISAAASLPAIAGMWLVRPLRDKMSPRSFRMVVLLFVLVAASQMIWKSGVFRHGGSHVTQVDNTHAGKQ
ncbi:sulfite exporter TauE/SafE family protein [Burkholderia cepacia]|uniref:sulfite exporter TauE/SafE family protein n=1 Tax=Burkholderia cepacia TaxID=292 RepID=UPI00075E166F|nr:sulfite exporter TauE/SafE family protein [Burkholderia cepacia]KVH77448.1 sulfite transporter TauE/SafE [Burkholderia cepacia]KWC72640.1 sulfite transporter TauE/SafE [Burkholderia cepacia]MCA8282440.1 sulfite exporter TauE/SafE family protein [Burkholderia cepacia]MDN7855976.1 sulfite exporter TauE/SafE family protein [Burkholderia cepacia]NTX44017.1 sulfite exporter TauE/SafE family protein [Burkholderia cepacia]